MDSSSSQRNTNTKLVMLALLNMLASTMAASVRMSKAAERTHNKSKLSNRRSGIVNNQRTLTGKKLGKKRGKLKVDAQCPMVVPMSRDGSFFTRKLVVTVFNVTVCTFCTMGTFLKEMIREWTSD